MKCVYTRSSALEMMTFPSKYANHGRLYTIVKQELSLHSEAALQCALLCQLNIGKQDIVSICLAPRTSSQISVS